MLTRPARSNANALGRSASIELHDCALWPDPTAAASFAKTQRESAACRV